ncbi:unnamed protein product [Spirodela intermedia]|uniref:Uncharacterized protein n=1 Tax=Spirodela intermedia TaxID=51605 RepID=A0A7I8J3V9_SPIIN|nr:unnamed protein product [Spirodela intermedia]CAA6664907.1 unnamed protein product [Spirodela intermedia]
MEERLGAALAPCGLAVVKMPDKGRGLLTLRDFSPGEVVIQQEPYASKPKFSSNGSSCDGCFALHNLKRCSACQMAWYCGSSCQKSEWKLHQLECKALSKLNNERRKMLTPSICLMLRLLLKRKLQKDKVIHSTATDSYDLVEALVSHMSDLHEKQLVLYAQIANLVNLVLPELEINIKEVTEIFSKLACNAHTICDSELKPLGTGLYPVISIINHSCLPNAVLVFEGRVAVVRAIEPIVKGTEVSISYIDTAATTRKRQKDLNEQYFFTCGCTACVKDVKASAVLEGYCCKDRTCDGFLLYDSGNRVFICQLCGLSRENQEIKKLEKETKVLVDKASRSLSSNNYYEANTFFTKIEEYQIELCHSFSIDLLRTRESLLKIHMELKDWNKALTYCRLTISVYERLYPAIHPLCGLQHYTCGKLEWLLEHTEAALKSFTKSVDILRITHGMNTIFMRELLSNLEEARREAAYRLSACD